MKIAISAESTIDLPKEILNKYNIKTVPFTILLGEETVLDGEVPTETIFNYVTEHKVLPKTSAVNEFQYEEHFANLLKDADAIVHYALSSEMSCAYTNAVKASKKFKNVYVVDSRSLSTGIALLAIKAAKMAEAGKSAEEIFEQTNADTALVQASFVINKLDYLKKGGRCSSLALLGANLLKIRPQIVVKNGKMVSGKKYRGDFNIVVKNYCADTLKEFSSYDNSLAFVTYTTASAEAVNYADEALKNAGFKEIYHTRAGGTIASHCGPNTLGILFLKK